MARRPHRLGASSPDQPADGGHQHELVNHPGFVPDQHALPAHRQNQRRGVLPDDLPVKSWRKMPGKLAASPGRFLINTALPRHGCRRIPKTACKRRDVRVHSLVTHLLRAGVDINTIRAWLGHVSLSTTNIYAEVDLQMKAQALALCEIKSGTVQKPWHADAG